MTNSFAKFWSAINRMAKQVGIAVTTVKYTTEPTETVIKCPECGCDLRYNVTAAQNIKKEQK